MSCGKHCTQNHDNHSGEQRTGKEYRFNQEVLDIMENMKKKETNYAVSSLMKLKEENIKRRNELKVEMKASIEEKLMLTSGAEPILKNQYHLCSNALEMRKKKERQAKRSCENSKRQQAMLGMITIIWWMKFTVRTQNQSPQKPIVAPKTDARRADYWIRYINDELTSEEIQEIRN